MNPPYLLIPFQLLGGMTFYIEKVKYSAVFLVPALLQDIEGGIHRLSYQFLIS
jgi:hypothetical protein